MRASFGRTWWGQQWLAAFSDIDNSNRLPRGRRYAGNGSVRSIEINDAHVNAQVQGSRRTPYRVQVALQPFAPAERHAVLKLAQRNPVLLSRLLNRQLPAQVAELLEHERVRLFPRRWKDVQASCSCPDWAVPCKHIAAVIYLVAAEIDKNPFLVFDLHGLNLTAALAHETGLQPQAVAALPVFADGWSNRPAPIEEAASDGDALEHIDLSRVPALRERILTVLAPEPLFHRRDFRRILSTAYERAGRSARAFDRSATGPWDLAGRVEHVHATVDGNGALLAMHADGQPLCGPGAAFTDWLAGLHALPAESELRLAPDVRLWRTLLRFALKLLECGALVPRVLAGRDGATLIHWQAAELDAAVHALKARLAGLCPPDLVLLVTGGKKSAHRHADGPTQIAAALHLLLSSFVRMGFEASADARAPDPVLQLFFGSEPVHFDRFENRQTPQLIGHWLRRLTLHERGHRLLLRVDESADETLSIALAVEGGGGIAPVSKWLAADRDGATRAALLADLALLAEYFPDVESLYAAGADDSGMLRYTLQRFTPILLEVLPALRMLGVSVALPRALRDLMRPRASLGLSASGSDAEVSYLNLEQLLQFDWQVAMGEVRMSTADFRRLVGDASGLVRLRGQYVLVDEADVRRLLQRLQAPPAQLSRAELLRAGLGGELGDAQITLDEDARQLLQQLTEPQAAPALPPQLQAQLRPYQQRGFEWLAQNVRLGFGALLADDMGLGKTLQAIALLLHLKAQGRLANIPALVVAPTSLLSNWHHEMQRFAPTLAVQVFHGAGRKLAAEGVDVVLTSYGLVRSDAKTLARPHWAAVVIDEAQAIKTPAAAQTRAVKRLKSDARIALSGTPVENRLREYWSVFDFINPGYLGTQKHFANTLAGPIERERDQAALARFRAMTAPFILRRLKSDKRVIADLPDKLEANRYCALSAEQASLYQSTVDAIMAELGGAGEGVERRGIVFKLLNALKQICNSPAQFLRRPHADPQHSGKLAAFLEIMREVDAAGEKALVFTQYTTMGELLMRALRETIGLEAPFLHGGRTRSQRDAMVAAFQGQHHPRVLIVSLKAGGTGLNLTAASQVVHYDLWWNPAVEQQATDRAYRIGQQRRVLVHRLITENTFEERIDAMIQSKKELADLTVASGEKWITELSDQELRALVTL